MFQSAAILLQSRAGIAKKENKLTTNWGSCYWKVGQVIQIGATLLQTGANITKWGNYYKVGRDLDQMYIKKSVRKVYCPPPFLWFAYLAQLRMETHVYR